tara:strand:+ start:249 stop:1259 length:1011 start_codon:yes stop_codon:yes gene_type:complete
MLDNNIFHDFNNIIPKDITDEFLFSIDSYRLFLESLSLNPLTFFDEWSSIKRQSVSNKYFKTNTNLDWKWSLSFPLFSLLEKYVDNVNHPMIIGFSGLPGSGKSTLGFWIDCLASDLDLDIKVISLDDFYLPGNEMDIVMQGNPWNVPRGYPGTHSIEVLNQSLDFFLKTGVLKSPTFDKSLREGKGDRSGWCDIRSKVLILEGWFVGCEPVSNLNDIDYIYEDKFNLCLSQKEKEYRSSIQDSLIEYSKIWKNFDKIWHLKASHFNNTILWKTQQEEDMIKLRGSGLKDERLTNFIRMIQASIPQKSLLNISSDTTIEINQLRRIEKLYTNTYIF